MDNHAPYVDLGPLADVVKTAFIGFDRPSLDIIERMFNKLTEVHNLQGGAVRLCLRMDPGNPNGKVRTQGGKPLVKIVVCVRRNRELIPIGDYNVHADDDLSLTSNDAYYASFQDTEMRQKTGRSNRKDGLPPQPKTPAWP